MAQDTLGMIMAPYNKDKGQVEEGGILPPPIPPETGGAAPAAAPGTPPAAPTAAPGTAAPAAPVAKVIGVVPAQQPRRMSYTEMLDKLSQYKPQTPEEIEEEKRREARQKRFASIDDGISALANMYFTSKGAPSMYDGRNSQTERVSNRWDKLRQEREAQKNEYMNAAIRAQAMDEEYADKERSWQRQLGIDKINADKIAEDQRRKDKIAEAQQQKYEAEKQKNVELANLYAEKADAVAIGNDHLADKIQAQINLLKAQKSKQDAEADRAHRQGTAAWVSGRGGGSSGGRRGVAKKGNEYQAWDENGNEMRFNSAKAAEQYARQHGTWVEPTYETTSTSTTPDVRAPGGVRRVTTKTQHRGKGYAARPKPKPAPQKPKAPAKKKTGVAWK